MRRLPIVLVALLALPTLAACGEDEEPTVAESTSFCELAGELDEEVPESYVGSDEHVEDLSELAAAAPEEIRPQAERVRNFYAAGLDPEDPDANLVENFPADVRQAIEELQAYIEEQC